MFQFAAMEYPGIVTILEDRDHFPQHKDFARLSSFIRIVSHEISHMWFGNLVTMKWWDDIWLNESFADFISFECMKYIQEQDWTSQFDVNLCFSEWKQWGYREDIQPATTHSIVCEINKTIEANTVFDGISYSKGAASIQQLFYLIGEETFFSAINQYFHQFQWKNSTLGDLIEVFQNELQKKSIALDLQKWKQDWLQTAGFNKVSVVKEGENIVLKQDYLLKNFPILR